MSEQKQPVRLTAGRTVRTIVGVIVILADVGAFFVNHAVIPLLTRTPATFEVKEIAMHATFLGLGVMLFDKDTGIEIVKRVLEKVPLKR